MSLVALSKVSKTFVGRPVLDGVSLDVPYQGKVGLVGENGSGKSTILKLMAGVDPPDSGEVHVARGVRLAYLPQTPDLHATHAAFDEVLCARPALRDLRDRMLLLERHLAAGPTSGDAVPTDYAQAVAEFSDAGGYAFEHEAAQVLAAFGLGDEQRALPVDRLSGGERGRVALTQALLGEPDLLLLDEPDNHLDIQGITWLEGMLKRFRGALVLVTHDRELVDRVVDSIAEIEDGRVTTQRGTFSDFLVRKRDRIERQKREYLEQQRRVRKLQQAVTGIGGHARAIEHSTIDFAIRKRALKIARRATVLRRRIERELADEQKAAKPRDQRDQIRVDVTPRRWHARTVLRMEGVGKRFGARTLFSDVELELARGQRIALVGPNGAGKTTLVEIALGIQAPDTGHVWVSAAASAFYCDQHHGGLEPDLTVYDTVAQNTELNRTQVHYLLSKLLFEGPDVNKSVGALSGGERTRLVLALLMNTGADLLMLDEPTNHLDLSGIEVLQEGLKSFAGALLFISHDRRLVGAVATDVLELANGGLSPRAGTTLGRPG